VAVQHIAGRDDARAAPYRAIADHETVASRGLFVAEGRLVVRRVIEDSRYRFQSLLVSSAALASLAPILASIVDGVPIYVCETKEFLGITGYDIHRGCLALVERPPTLTVSEAIEQSLADGPQQVTVAVLEDVANPDNVGGVFRNAAAFRAGAVLLSPSCCDPLYRKAIRTSMAATLRVPFARVETWPAGLEALQASGFTLVALTPDAAAQSIDEFLASRPARVALLVGTEGEGLTDRVAMMADRRVRIPIEGHVDSLNLSVAAGIALHRLYR
jgi:tRNA G18 (ribose-2'-O)-methylase SpoU